MKCKMYSGQDMLFDKEDKQPGNTTGAGTAVQRIPTGHSPNHTVRQVRHSWTLFKWMIRYENDDDDPNDSNTNIFSNAAMTIKINQKKTNSRLCI